MKNIEFYFKDIEALELPGNAIKGGIIDLIREERGVGGNINIIFCSDEYLLNINKQYLGHDYYTDIITFDYVEKDIISGDLFISVDRIRENSVTFGSGFRRELFRVIFHGILHLCGYEDSDNILREQMRCKEDYYLGKVDFKSF